ncbi:MAG: bifunctional folylpolyglutamate synthase/dihydrofolate synthase, partial [Longimicrobiales bacterium]
SRTATARPRHRAEFAAATLASTDYRELVNRLFPRLGGGIRWGLDRTEELLRLASNPHQKYRSVHIAGTNGKGSVAATLASVLEHAGLRTGLYSSPHLTSFRERIRINGVPISEQVLQEVAHDSWPSIERTGASFFEATTVLAFSAMARAQVDIAVIEVGLGGRLDATNVITPEVTVITNIAIDHAEYLGHTLTEIAGEKAGIIKPHVPLVTAESQPQVLDVFRARCEALGAPLETVLADPLATITRGGVHFAAQTRSWGRLHLSSPLIGAHQVQNCALAVAALDHMPDAHEITRGAVEQGVARVRWPGRFQIHQAGRTWIFDVAHNEAGVNALVDTFQRLEFPLPVVLLVGILGDKDWARMLPPLFDLAQRVVLTVPPSAPANRTWDPVRVVHEVFPGTAIAEPNFVRALELAQELSAPQGTILVTGSFHTVGDAQAELGWSEVEPDFPLQHKVFRG